MFRLREEVPFGREYLLRFVKSVAGREEIDRHTEGSVRARLYFANFREVEVPFPMEPEQWENLLASLSSLRSHVSKGLGSNALSSLGDALVAHGVDGEADDGE